MTDDRNLYRELVAVKTAARPFKWAGAHDTAMAWNTGMKVTHAWALVNGAIDKPDVVAVLPGECSRLRRIRERRRAARRR